MRWHRAPFSALDTFFAVRSWVDCTTSMSGFDLRQAQPDAVPADETSTVPLKPAAYETVVPLANPKRVWFEARQFRLKSRNTTSVSALDCSGDTPARIPNKAHHDCFR